MQDVAITAGGIWDRSIGDMPVAVLDFETTGMWAGPDRVVEVAIVRVDPGQTPRLVIDTLVHPDRPVGATYVHGITDADVADAPRFRDIAGHILDAIEGCAVAAYNVGFDIPFLRAELQRIGVRLLPPQLCLMYLRPLLGLGRVCKLGEACRRHGVRLERAHAASDDTLAAAQLWVKYRHAMAERHLRTFRDLANLRSYKFVQSFGYDLPTPVNGEFPRGPLKPRTGRTLFD